MTLIEANQLLDKQKDGIVRQSLLKVTEALWITGDCSRSLSTNPRSFDKNGIDSRMESPRMAQSQGIGQRFDGTLAGNQSGFDQKDERNQ